MSALSRCDGSGGMGKSRTEQAPDSISPTQVRYIKLGEGGSWEAECLEKGIVRFGFGTASADRFALCRDRRWEELTNSFISAGRSRGTATRFTNETRLFFEDDGSRSTLWITFVGERLYWGFLTSDLAKPHPDQNGVLRRVRDGWQCTDLKKEKLTKDRLMGALTQLSAYRGTSCSVRARGRGGVDVADYVIRRINGEKRENVERALTAISQLKVVTVELIRDLQPRDFKILVDLIFTTSGWRRLGTVGGTQKTLDLDLTLPTTGERAFVQVKSKTTASQLAEYIRMIDQLGLYDRMFYVYHTGEVDTDDERVTVIKPDKLAELVLNAGLVNWLIDKVS
jgi:hypothetical protein